MQIHHDKHHQTYVTNLNNLVASLPTNLSSLPVDELVTHLDDIPAQNRTGVRNNAGGHANHSFFWKSLQLNTTLEGDLLAAIERDFGSVDAFKAGFAANATKVFGSGWAWLIAQDGGKLKVVSTANQDSPLMDEKYAGNGTHGYPIIGLDVWEHAYYLKYQNLRVDYIQSYWNVTNWEFASQRYAEALAMG
jgi:Fe-Mn family superoxide dismutase